MSLREKLAETSIVNFAAALALIIFLALASVHVSIAVQAPDPLEAFKDVILWVLPVILNILATYGIIRSGED